jgi:hypothetical protein
MAGREDAALERQLREFRDRLHAQFRRHRCAMPLHGPLMDAKIAGDLFVEPPRTT